MTKHTQGPWLVEGRTVYALNDDGYNRFSALVQDAHTPRDELEANARLIASAPELLEALELLSQSAPAASCDMFHHEKQDRHTFIEECPALARYEHACLKARAAIAKARGEA